MTSTSCAQTLLHRTNLLLDTHAFLWFMEDSERITAVPL
jgi:hypothetical protein